MLRRILIIDEAATRRVGLQARLRAACYDLRAACGLREGLAQLRDHSPDLMLLSGSIPGFGGASACELLRRRSGLPGLPVLTLLRSADGPARLTALMAGASDVLSAEAPSALLMAQIRSLLRQSGPLLRDPLSLSEEMIDGFREPSPAPLLPAQIAVVAPNPLAERLSGRLTPLIAPHRLVPVSPAAVLELGDADTDAILLCPDTAPCGQGLDLLAELLARRLPSGAPVIWASPPEGEAAAAAALDLGADGVLPAGFTPPEAALRLRRLLQRRQSANARLRLLHDGLRLALTDPLTGLSNRRHALPALSRMLEEAAASGETCAVMLLDLDHFKAVNDTFGHAAGDDVLTEVARRLRSDLPPGDLVARYGGEEFLIAARLCNGRDALALADRLRRNLTLSPFLLPAERRSLPVTASIGLALSGGAACQAGEMLRRADEALLIAKRQGRDQVCLARQIAA
ncbi:GGDEF domain-containing response regulator [Falsigemmobacter faecalis]|uniref:diguanylate cyclase n=1 Tax=Falsigemmobacter faecalis TaxID=2488730 RepID=A0A3P3DS00_9RHOB|nr:diguanylate cyclase [Falsigemmobacter faecalis]RRH76941.1 diguanylate cyclase [Falsigemmobacter faecalis]